MPTQWGHPTGAGPSRTGRLARAGTLAVAGFVVWMVAGRAMLGSVNARPPLILVGWGVLRDALELRGYALGAFRLALGGLWVALPLWAITAGFRRGPAWLAPAGLVIGLGGLFMALPLLIAVAVVAANAALWGLGVVVGLLLLAALLLRAVTAPFRRW